MTRDDAYALLTEYTKTPSLIGHALAVEAAMRFYAAKLGGDPEEWAAVGLLHDMDYERWPDLEDHPFRGAEIMRDRGVPELWIRAVLSHGDHTGVPRETPMEKALFAVDELTGFIVACALVRPSRSLADLGAKSVKKKMKDRSFAAKVNREAIEAGAAV
ncbi:MAG TPA: HDIG domain-containing protein, partial [Armatimonadota bacterium]|nr:HDIG domain-containing protein [Armatimonadota bacterium]